MGLNFIGLEMEAGAIEEIIQVKKLDFKGKEI